MCHFSCLTIYSYLYLVWCTAPRRAAARVARTCRIVAIVPEFDVCAGELCATLLSTHSIVVCVHGAVPSEYMTLIVVPVVATGGVWRSGVPRIE